MIINQALESIFKFHLKNNDKYCNDYSSNMSSVRFDEEYLGNDYAKGEDILMNSSMNSINSINGGNICCRASYSCAQAHLIAINVDLFSCL